MDPNMMPNPGKMLGLQAQVRHNAAEISEYFSDLGKWEEEVKAKDKAILKGDLNPASGKKKATPGVRQKGFVEMVPSGVLGPKDKERKKKKKGDDDDDEETRIKPKNYQDYNQWDQFVHKDLDKMLEDFDENDRQEQEEGHRNRLAEERRKIDEQERLARAHVEEAERLKNLGNDLLKSGDLEGARNMYGRAIETDEKNHVPFANRAQVYLKLEMYEDAIKDCDSALAIDPRYVKALMRRGTAKEATGDKAGAIADLKKAVMLEPSNKQAKDHIKALSMTDEEKAEAERAKEEEEKRKAAIAEKEAKEKRKKERGGKKLMVREASDTPATRAGDADPTTRPARVKIVEQEEVEGGGGGGGSPGGKSSSPGGGGGEGGGGVPIADPAGKGHIVIGMEDAITIAREAREAVQAKLDKEPMQLPANSIEFERLWKRVRSSKDKATEFLASIPPSKLPTYFKSDIDDEVLSALIGCINTVYLPSRLPEALELLSGLLSLPRFSIAVKLMSKRDREALGGLISRIEGSGGGGEVCSAYLGLLAK